MGGYDLRQAREFAWLETMVRQYTMFENWPVTRSSLHVQFEEEEANMATSSCRLQIQLKLLDF